MKAKSIKILIFILSICLLISCKKSSDNSSFSEKEQNIISASETFFTDAMVDDLKDQMIEGRSNNKYNTDLDSLTASIYRLRNTISKINENKSSELKNSHFSENDFKNQLLEFQNKLITIYGSIECGLKYLGLGYGKGITVDISGGSIPIVIVELLTVHGGGGVEIVYDFPTMQRSIFPYTVCGVSGEIGIELQDDIIDLNLSGYYDWITGFSSNSQIYEYEGPGQSFSIGPSIAIKELLGIGLGLEVGAWSDRKGECNSMSIIQCPVINPEWGTIKGYTVGFSASAGFGGGLPFSLGINAGLIGSCSFYKDETTKNFLDSDLSNEKFNRFFASCNMANEILLNNPTPGMMNPFVINDITAACAALTYGFFDPSDCISPSRPQLQTPVQGYVTSSFTPTLTCQVYLGATNYNFQVATESDFQNPIFNVNINSCQQQISAGILSAGNQYFWRVRVTTLEGTVSLWSDVWSFSTSGDIQLPNISTIEISNITQNSAQSGGIITEDGGGTVSERGVCWSTSQNPVYSGNHTSDGSGIGSFTSNITGLLANTLYYVRAYATNSAGTGYGNQISFTTVNIPSSDVILPLAIGNYWIYLPDITPQTMNISITGTIDVQSETCFKWYAQGDPYEWYYKNKSDGCWAYGYSGTEQYPPDLEYKFPANAGDTWVTNWIAVPFPTTMTCESTSATFESYSGCYKYHFLMPFGKDNFCTINFKSELEKIITKLSDKSRDAFDIYQYFIPGIGMVGWEVYYQGTYMYKVVLTDYHLN